MNVLVLGGSRFIGRRLVWRLLAAEHRVTLFNRGQSPDPFGPRVERLRGDRTVEGLGPLLQGRRFEAVVDLTAYHGREVDQALAALSGGGVAHYILISTGQVYLVRQGCGWPAREVDSTGPVMERPAAEADAREWEYGMGKRACEDVLLEAWRASGFPATVLRLPVVNGEGDPSRRLEGYLWRLLDGGPLLLPDGGLCVLRHVYVGDVAAAIVGLLGRSATFGRAYNICQEERPTLRELVELLARLLGAAPRLVEVPSQALEEAGLAVRAVSPFSSRWISHLDPALARAELGFVATPLAQAMESIVASFLAHTPSDPPEGYRGRARERELG